MADKLNGGSKIFAKKHLSVEQNIKTEIERRYSDPKNESLSEHVGKAVFDLFFNLLIDISGAEMGGDDHFVFKFVFTIDDIFQMDVTVFVNGFFSMAGSNEGHFQNEYVRAVKIGIEIKAAAGTVAEKPQSGITEFVRNWNAGKIQIADLFAGERKIFLFQFMAAFPNEITDRRNGMKRFDGFDVKIPGQLESIARLSSDDIARELSAVKFGEDMQELFDIVDLTFRDENIGGIHFHHSAPGDISGQGENMIHMRMRNEPVRSTHEFPRLPAEIESEPVFGDAPVSLNSGAGVTFDRNTSVFNGPGRLSVGDRAPFVFRLHKERSIPRREFLKVLGDIERVRITKKPLIF